MTACKQIYVVSELQKHQFLPDPMVFPGVETSLAFSTTGLMVVGLCADPSETVEQKQNKVQ